MSRLPRSQHQIQGSVSLGCRYVEPGVDNHKIGRRQIRKRINIFAFAYPQRRSTLQEERDIRSKFGSHAVKFIRWNRQLPESAEPQQSSGRVSTPAPQASAHRDTLTQQYLGTLFHTGLLGENLCRFPDEVAFCGNTRQFSALERQALVRMKFQIVVNIYRLKHRPDFMKLIDTAAQNGECKIDLRERSYAQG